MGAHNHNLHYYYSDPHVPLRYDYQAYCSKIAFVVGAASEDGTTDQTRQASGMAVVLVIPSQLRPSMVQDERGAMDDGSGAHSHNRTPLSGPTPRSVVVDHGSHSTDLPHHANVVVGAGAVDDDAAADAVVHYGYYLHYHHNQIYDCADCPISCSEREIHPSTTTRVHRYTPRSPV